MNSPHLSDNNVIFQTKNIDSRVDGHIYVKEQKGYFQAIRRKLGWILSLLFIAIPFMQYQGEQAILFDVGTQKINFFALAFYPQDLMILALLLLFSAFGLFYLSSKYGRVWCGYVCPQTIWTLLFVWVEHRVEGNRQQRMQLNKAPTSFKKIRLKLAKHFIWLIISLITATVFMSYFIPAHEIYLNLVTGELTSLVMWWIVFFCGCTYVNAGWIREKMCEHMCPYARFQSVMFNKNSKIISYDNQRGENRGPRKIGATTDNRENALGDCVDCKLCVQVCPVGIDIRNGLQYECISCGLCIDACDQTMEKFSYKKGLIKYTSESQVSDKKSTSVSYAIVMLAIVSAFYFWFDSRSIFEVSITKDRQALYRETNEGNIENYFQIKLFNKSKSSELVKIKLANAEASPAQRTSNLAQQLQLKLSPRASTSLKVEPNSSALINVTVQSPKGFKKSMTEFDFVFENIKGELLFKKKSTFHAM